MDTDDPFLPTRCSRWAQEGNFCHFGLIAAAIPALAGGGAAAGGASALSTGLGLAGAGISAIGSIAQGNAASAAASYEAQVARNNQLIAEQNANYTTAAGETRAFQQSVAERQKAQAITAGLAASGLDVNTGSARDVRSSEAALGQEDVENVRHAAALEAYGYKTQATNFAATAQLKSAESGFDATSGWIKGLGGLLSGVSKFGGGGNTLNPSETWGDTGGYYQNTFGAVV